MPQSKPVQSAPNEAFANVVLQLADDHLILGHRLSEWCGHAPMLEEDLSLPNMALDLIGQARTLYQTVAELDGSRRTEDELAYLRTEREYTNCLLVERPNIDFAHTILRQFYFAVFMQLFWRETLKRQGSELTDIAGKAIKEIGYHGRHSGEWLVRLGDGTEESAARMAAAVDVLHPYSQELFELDANRKHCVDRGWITDPSLLQAEWQAQIDSVFLQARLSVPEVAYPQTGGRLGKHTEDMGFLLAELQYLQRTYPGAEW